MKSNNKIDADDVTLVSLLDHQKFTIDYFQREFRWERKHIEQLIDDLTTSFLNDYDDKHEREEVEDYNCYYMGPVVISNKEGKLSIIDGQQRITSLTLLLIYLNNLQKTASCKESVGTLIFSERHGKKSYNMQVEEREECFDALFNTGQYDPSGEDESVANLVNRYNDIAELYPDELKNNALPYFISWLKENIIFVKIVTYSEENAYTIFETMNDRGLNLTPSEMLKGYLLSKIKDTGLKNKLNIFWKHQISELHEWSSVEDLEFFKSWLRAKYADTIRPGKKGSSNEDFEKIGTTFHTWVKDKIKLLDLQKEKQYIDFVDNEFNFYSKLYIKILAAQSTQTKGLESVYSIDWFGIARSLSYPLLMAPITKEDSDEVQNKKLQLVAHFIEYFSVVRSVNQRTLGQSSLRYTIYSLVKEIRNNSVERLAIKLKRKVKAFEETFEGIGTFNINQQNKRFVRFYLARITTFIENECGINTSIDDYMSDDVKKPAQIEHIWADMYEQHKDEFDQKDDFQFFRNSLGGLILLPKGTNQSFNRDPYPIKLPHYLKQNLLAQSLHKDCYVKNPNFIKWYKENGLSFKPHDKFCKKDIEERETLYKEISALIWSPESFDALVK